MRLEPQERRPLPRRTSAPDPVLGAIVLVTVWGLCQLTSGESGIGKGCGDVGAPAARPASRVEGEIPARPLAPPNLGQGSRGGGIA